MDDKSVWVSCRLLSIEGGTSKAVGPPKARCSNAAWSPDGRWMYFSADAGDGFHVWRQRFPDGAPEQLTFGPTEEEGLAIARDGHSLITSSGLTQRSVWFHDGSGDHQISLEGTPTSRCSRLIAGGCAFVLPVGSEQARAQANCGWLTWVGR